ncbi:molybdenum cofactor guanylyltransferase [Parapedobacter sp. DT-150]|uniref:molybdenum cofactor guanylyltransferase n=1 Tax=Parapedobacter sp. DT-150 TaxID=3396162 RepID=UPI003F1C1F11
METIGAVLCGGRSSRMGTDKGLLLHDGQHWAGRAYEVLQAVVPRGVLSVNAQQRTAYGAIFTAAACVEDDGELPIGGPLRGLLSVHRRFPTANVLVLACDLVDMETSVLQRLMDRFTQEPSTALVFVHDGVPQPLCGVYAAPALAAVADRVMAAGLVRNSMMHVLEFVGAATLPCPVGFEHCFNNYNSP